MDWIAELERSAAGRRVLEIAGALHAAGGRAVLVGGAIRDGLLGIPVKDLDVEVFGLELDVLDRVLKRFGRVVAVGRAFGVTRLTGLDVDFSLPRRDNNTGPGHRGFDVRIDPSLPFEEAARRRDLTINSMGVDLGTGALLDPHAGRADLDARVLRATDPDSFPEDPLRAMRVAQFAARFCFEPTPELIALCSTLDLSELPGERLWNEFVKLLCKGREPSRGLAFLRDAELLRFFPELESLIDVPQDAEWHPEGDVWIHTLMTVDRAAEMRTGDPVEDEALMFGALCHDFGKPSTTEHEQDRIRSKGHDRGGIEPTLAFLDRLRAPNDCKRQVAALVDLHLAPALYVENGAGPRGYRRLARRLDEVGLTARALERVARADHFGRTTDEAVRREFPAGREFLARVEELELTDRGPKDVVLGRHLIAAGLEPSVDFSEILRRCRDVQDETGSTDVDAILARVLAEDGAP